MAGSDYEHKPNSGTMFVNGYKTSENQPDMKGEGKGECPHCKQTWAVDLALWKRVSKGGKGYVTLSFKPDDRPQEQDAPRDEDIPF